MTPMLAGVLWSALIFALWLLWFGWCAGWRRAAWYCGSLIGACWLFTRLPDSALSLILGGIVIYFGLFPPASVAWRLLPRRIRRAL